MSTWSLLRHTGRLLVLTLPLATGFAGQAEEPTTPAPGFKSITTRSVAANRIPARPAYVHSLGSDLEWLDFGLASRARYEYRWNDYSTTDLVTNDALVSRNLLYLGVKDVIDPLRLSLELEDSRRFLSNRAPSPAIEDELELLQAYMQLRFDHVIGDQALSLSFGRMAFDWADRRLIARNRNRNTISAFDGLRLRLGDEKAPWEIDAIAVRPVARDVEDLDESSADASLYGLAGYWRGWSPKAVLEPWWLWSDQRAVADAAQRRNLHTVGLHGFGQWGIGQAWDYDLSLAGQWGDADALDHHAWATHCEIGHTWPTQWKPRLAVWINYATGDSDPGDGRNGRFDPLYGATFAFYGYTSLFSWQNTVNPAVRISFQPNSKLRCELIHRAIWLASDSDAWVRGKRRDASGSSGSYVGQELDARIAWTVCKNFDIDLAYAHFFPGGFVGATGVAPGSDLIQIAGTLRW